MEIYPQVMMNVKIPASFREVWKNDSEIEAKIERFTEELGKNGRILVRESGTEPLIRVMLEGKVFADINRMCVDICETIKGKIPQ
jgi:phosphoglucosamine mutase